MSAAPGRRQSTRQVTRTSRPHNYYARNFSGRAGVEQSVANNSEAAQPGFVPAISHFTEAIDALPKEVIRHFSMLKEVEAKLHVPDEQIRRLSEAITKLPRPHRNHPPPQPYFPSLSAHNSVNGSRHGSVVGAQASDMTTNPEVTEAADRERQYLFYQLNMNIAMMAPALDEKIAVLSTANQTLQRQIDRMTSSYLHIPEEVSDEARLGNPKHWAYVNDKETKKAPERSRREVANPTSITAAAQALEGEFASRSEARREAVAARKNRNHQVDSDFDDRPAPRKGPGKAKKTVEDPKTTGLGIVNGAAGPTKRRKVTAGAPMERSLSGALANARGPQASPRDTPEIVPKKRSKPGPAPKKRAPGNASPHITSSPVIGTFPIKEPPIRPGTGRGRQNSATNSIHSATVDITRHRPPSAQSNKVMNSTLPLTAYEQLQQSAAVTAEINEALKPLPEQAKTLKSEETEVIDEAAMPEADTPLAIAITTRAGRASKTATPLSSTFPDLTGPRGRSSRAKDATGENSHASSESGEQRNSRRGKKSGDGGSGTATAGSGSAAPSVRADNDIPTPSIAQNLAITTAALETAEPEDEMDVDEADMDDPEAGEGEEGNEPKYCYCNDVSYGEMVACDNEACPREWFHLKCAGLSRAPDENTKWYCDDCKSGMKESKRSRPVSRRE